MTPSSANRTRLTLKEKLEICDDVAPCVKYSALATKYKVAVRTIARIKRGSTRLRKKADTAGISTVVKSIRKAQFSDIERRLYSFVQCCRQARQPVTLATLSYRALKTFSSRTLPVYRLPHVF